MKLARQADINKVEEVRKDSRNLSYIIENIPEIKSRSEATVL